MQIQEFRPSESGLKTEGPGLFAYRYKQKCLGLAILGILRLSEMDTNSILYLYNPHSSNHAGHPQTTETKTF